MGWLLESHRNEEAIDLGRDWLTVSPFGADLHYALALAHAEKLELTLARISAVVGEGRAGSPHLLDTHRPQAFEMEHFMPSDSARTSSSSNNEHGTTSNLVTALRIFRPPIQVAVSQQDGRPSHISSHKRNQIAGDVLWAAGPWRSSGDWWEQDAWVRDEWDIAVQEKTGIVLYRLVHDLIARRWLLEGSYD